MGGARETKRAFVRVDWVRRINDVCQVLVGTAQTADPRQISEALARFRRCCPMYRTTAERLVLQGVLMEQYLRLDAALSGHVTSSTRLSALNAFVESSRRTPIERFLAAADVCVSGLQSIQSAPLHERARILIQDKCTDRRRIGELTKVLNAHPRTLTRQFVRHYGLTPQEFRRRCRAAYAEQLFRSTDVKVDVLIEMLGVRSKSTVYRWIKRYGGQRRRATTDH